MNKAVPWSIKGVDFDAREAAKEAARRSGMTLGEWLNSVIADQAAESGVDVEEVDDTEKLEAVASRLLPRGQAGHDLDHLRGSTQRGTRSASHRMCATRSASHRTGSYIPEASVATGVRAH